MYRSYFGLSENPFSLTPDPRFLFLSARHREGIAHLIYGMGRGGGFVQLTGEVGTGKTTLYRSVLAHSHKNVDIALVLNPRQTAFELLASICDELHVEYDKTTSIKDLVDALNRHLLKAHAQGRRTVLIIDEAQNLDISVLEQIRLLTNLETAKHKLLQIVLIGQPELQKLLKRADLRQLNQRITARYHLTPLSAGETSAYILHRLRRAGRTTPLFTESAMQVIHRLSGGVPRLVNIICERSLLAGYAEQRSEIGPKIVRKAALESAGKKLPPRLTQAAAVAASVVIVGVLLAWLLPGAQSGSDGARTDTAQQTALPAEQSSPTTDTSTPSVNTKLAAITRSNLPAETALHPDPQDSKSTDSQTSDTNDDMESETIAQAESTLQNPSTNVSTATATPIVEHKAKLRDQLRDGTLKTDTTTAFTTLFRYWDLDYKNLPGKTVCARAEAGGLRCIARRGSLSSVRVYERPTVFDLIDNYGSLHRATIVQLNDNEATLDFGGRIEKVSLAQLEAAWFGSYVLLWRPPKIGTQSLQEGSRGPEVVWLRKQLDRAENYISGDAPSPYFDERLTLRVVNFQRTHGIPADGVVGQQTMLKINSVTANPPVPLLSRATPYVQGR